MTRINQEEMWDGKKTGDGEANQVYGHTEQPNFQFLKSRMEAYEVGC